MWYFFRFQRNCAVLEKIFMKTVQSWIYMVHIEFYLK